MRTLEDCPAGNCVRKKVFSLADELLRKVLMEFDSLEQGTLSCPTDSRALEGQLALAGLQSPDTPGRSIPWQGWV